MKPIGSLSLVLALMCTGAALAGPLEDGQARTAELEKTMHAQAERLARLESQFQNQGLLNLLNQVETLKAEVARLRGTLEEHAFQMATADKRVKDLFADLDGRVRELAERPVALPAEAIRLQVSPALNVTSAPAVDAEAEARAYETAHTLVKNGRYMDAVASLQDFLRQHPNGALAPNAMYWTGFSYVGMSDFRNAAISYQRLLKEFPGSPKAADAMLSLARARVHMNELEAARASLEQLIEKHPYSRAAESGKKLLSTLK